MAKLCDLETRVDLKQRIASCNRHWKVIRYSLKGASNNALLGLVKPPAMRVVVTPKELFYCGGDGNEYVLERERAFLDAFVKFVEADFRLFREPPIGIHRWMDTMDEYRHKKLSVYLTF